MLLCDVTYPASKVLSYFFDVTLSAYPHRTSLKNMPATVRIEPTTFGILAQCSANNTEENHIDSFILPFSKVQI
jgi:hypothetical protein